MPGQMGNVKVTVQCLKIVRVDVADNLFDKRCGAWTQEFNYYDQNDVKATWEFVYAFNSSL
jgi:ribosomal protein L3